MAPILVMLTLAQQPPVELFERSAPFESVSQKDGLTLTQRSVPSSALSEYRVETQTSLTVEQLCDAVYEWGTRQGDGPNVTLHKVLRDGADLRVVYDQISAPVVANRDYALTVIRERPGPTTCRIRFWVTNELAPPKPDGFVRMSKLWGEWLFEQSPTGATLRYTLFSDPAGSVPAFLVRGPQREATVKSVQVALEKTRAAQAK